MSALNGTNVLIYANGQPIAMQKGLTLGIDIDLTDATSKDSAGWAEHLTGLINAKIDFTALFGTGLLSDTPAVLSAKDLMDYIINQDTLLVSILGGTFPIVGQADMSSISFDAPMEGAMALTGSMKVNGKLYPLTGAMAQLLTVPDAGGSSYDHFTISGTSITQAVNDAGTADTMSNEFSVINGDILKFITYLTSNSGQLPNIVIQETGVTALSSFAALVVGLNIVSLTIINAVTANDSAALIIGNTAAADWLTTPIYLFKS
jgi:predicted secreted protein